MEIQTPPKEEYKSLEGLKTPRLGKRLAKILLTVLFLLLVLMFLPWQQSISGYGNITAFNPRNRPQTLQNVIGGRILKWYIVEGQTVTTGDTLIHIGEVKDEYFDPQLQERLQNQIQAKKDYLAATRNQIRLAENQVQALRQGLDLSLEKAQNKISQARNNVVIDSANLAAERIQFELAQRQLNRYEELYSKNGLISLTDLERRRQIVQEKGAKLVYSENKFLNSKQELLNSRIEVGSIRADYIDKISKVDGERASKTAQLAEAEKELSELTSKAASVAVRQAQYYILAPQTGFVSKVLKAGIGEIIKEGEPIVTIVPEHADKAAEVFIRPMDLPLVKVGQEVRLEFDGYPALTFSGWQNVSVGTFGGIVAVVDMVTNSNGNYRLLVKPDPKDTPWPEAIQFGSGVKAWAMLKNVPLWYELWRLFNGFPPDPITGPAPKTELKK